MGLREGDLHPLRRYAWYALRVRHGGRKGKTLEEFGGLQGLPDGTHNLGEVIASGVPEGSARPYPVQALASGELSPPGQGWLLRDLTWERARPLGKSCPCARLFAPATGVRRPSPPEPPPLPSSGSRSLPSSPRGEPSLQGPGESPLLGGDPSQAEASHVSSCPCACLFSLEGEARKPPQRENHPNHPFTQTMP
jgi:hypothetical protein